MNEIILFGGGGHSYAVIELIKSLGNFNPIFVYDDQPKENTILQIPLKKFTTECFDEKALCISIGNNSARKAKALLFSKANFPTFIHQNTVIYPSVSVGRGTVVMPNSVLDAQCTVGDFCIINNHATVSHQVVLGNYVHVAINAAIAGGVSVGEGALLGAGCTILPEITIGKWATIGAGAVVTKNVPDYGVVYGNPAKLMKFSHES